MKKAFFLIVFILISILVFAQETYYIGDGRSDLSVEVGEPELSNIGTDASWIPGFVINTINDDIAKYSAIKIVDTYNQKKIIAALKKNEGALYSEEDAIELGNFAVAKQMIIVNIIGKNSSYSVSVKINDKERNTVLASYNANCLYAELESGSVLKQATLDLLTQLKVNLTESAKKELTQIVASNTTIEAQKLQAKAVTALEEGSNIQALSYLFDARAKDDNLASVNNAISKISTSIAGGTLSEKAQSLIQNRKDFAALLDKMRAFYKTNPPYFFIVCPVLEKTQIDYKNDKVNLYFIVRCFPKVEDVKIQNKILAAYRKQEDSNNWRLDTKVIGDVDCFMSINVRNTNNEIIGTKTFDKYDLNQTLVVSVNTDEEIDNLKFTVDDITWAKNPVKMQYMDLDTFIEKIYLQNIEFIDIPTSRYIFISPFYEDPYLLLTNQISGEHRNLQMVKNYITEQMFKVIKQEYPVQYARTKYGVPENACCFYDKDNMYTIYLDSPKKQALLLEEEAERIKSKEILIKECIEIPKDKEKGIKNIYVSNFFVSNGMYNTIMEGQKAYPKVNIKDDDLFFYSEKQTFFVQDWREMLAFCNRLSIAHGLKPCYSVRKSKDPNDWFGGEFEYGPTQDLRNCHCDFNANGYRLPTKSERAYLSDLLPAQDGLLTLTYDNPSGDAERNRFFVPGIFQIVRLKK